MNKYKNMEDQRIKILAQECGDWVSEQEVAIETIEILAKQMIPYACKVWDWGDGEGGYVTRLIAKAFLDAGFNYLGQREFNSLSKSRQVAKLRGQVLERDAYRCQKCGDWHDLQIDHIYPASKGGKTVIENLQVLCGACNGKKAAKVECGVSNG